MSEQIKMTDMELSEVKMIQEKFQQKVVQLGHITLQKKQLENSTKTLNDQENKAWEEWASLQKMETELIDKLLGKYGEGSLDLNAGTFIPEKKSTS